MLGPLNGNVVIDNGAVNELCRTAIGATDHLAGPAAFDLVHELFLGDGDFRRNTRGFRRFFAAGAGNDSQCTSGKN